LAHGLLGLDLRWEAKLIQRAIARPLIRLAERLATWLPEEAQQ